VHVASSGNHVQHAERADAGECLLGGGEVLLPGEVRLGEGESYSSSWLYGAYSHGPDAIAGCFHQHLRGRVRPVSAERPATLNVWEAVNFQHDRDRLLDVADRAAGLGMERFVLDDGRFGVRRHERAGLGDSIVAPDVWPDGLHPLVDRVRKLGMQFGLSFEPEMVNADSEFARAHPEWIMSARPEWPAESRHQQVFNLGISGTYAHVQGQILALLEEYDIGYIKWDHNRDLIKGCTQTDGAGPACTPRPSRSTACWTRSARRTRTWRSSRARRAARGLTWRCWSAPTGCGYRTKSTRTTGSGCCAGPASCCLRPPMDGGTI
jgi:alpha-galactosidase